MLIEVLVSALVITIVAGAVLALVSATTRSAADQRTHSAAYAAAQEDQARLRSMRISSLNRLNQTRDITLGGSKFTVTSTGVFVNNATGTDSSCVSGGAKADYVRINSTVTWPNMGKRKAVVMQSIVSPSSGSLDPSHGTLTIVTKNAKDEPLSGVGVSGPTFSGSTDSTGCANFADLPSGNLKLTTSATGLVDAGGNLSPWSTEAGVIPSSTQSVSLRYDRPGTVPFQFKYRVGSGSEFKPAYADSVFAFNVEMPKGGRAYWTPTGLREATVKATPLFPFKGADTFYAGSCESNNPDPEAKFSSRAPAMPSVLVPAGLEFQPPPVIQLPALKLTVTYNGSPVVGARVTISDERCETAQGNDVKRVYTTNAGGNQSSATNGEIEAGLPWGTYAICASARVRTNEDRRLRLSSVAVESLTSEASRSLSLSSGSSESNRTCS